METYFIGRTYDISKHDYKGYELEVIKKHKGSYFVQATYHTSYPGEYTDKVYQYPQEYSYKGDAVYTAKTFLNWYKPVRIHNIQKHWILVDKGSKVM